VAGVRDQIRKWLGIILLMFADLVVYGLSLGLAHAARLALNEIVAVQFRTPFHYYIFIWWIPLVYLVIYIYEGLYSRRSPYWDEVGRLLRADFIGTGAIFAILTLLKMSDRYSRLLLLLMWLFLVFLHPLFRFWGKRILFSLGIWREKVAVWGTGPLAVSLAKALISDRHMGFELIGFISFSPIEKTAVQMSGGHSFPILGTLESAIDSGAVSRSTRIALADEEMTSESASARLNDMVRYFHNILLVPSALKIPVLNTEPLHLFREQMMVLKIRNNLLSPLNRIIKRGFDLVLTFLVLPFLLPLGLFLALLIRLESSGEVIFSQERIGHRGKRFRLYKFRSMYRDNDRILKQYLAENSEAEVEWKRYRKFRGTDPRVTRVGRFLRKASLDELPQFLNVLKGEMSLVGPRPYLPGEREEMGAKFDIIVEARPGISGLWQVSGRNNLDFTDRLRLDEWYVSNWTLWLDVEILVKTVGVVLKRDGAY